MNLPNTLTLMRVLLIPLFVILIINKAFGWALVTFAVAGITDAVDGLIARVTGQRTELGAYLDPIADKLLLSSAFVTLAIIELIPSWLTVIVVTRDIIILIGFLMFFLTNHHPKMGPSLVSKITTFFQILTILLFLISEYYLIPKGLYHLAIYGVVVFTIISGIHYIFIGTRVLNEKKNH
jgi:cardiolipin synthase (CMP-forming)